MSFLNIKTFSIFGLFGTKDVHIPFDNDIKIIVGENGLGKTQVLNIMYATFQLDFGKLGDAVFDKIEIQTEDTTIYTLTKTQVTDYLISHSSSDILRNIEGIIGIGKMEEMKALFVKKKYRILENVWYFYKKRSERVSKKLLYSYATFFEELQKSLITPNDYSAMHSFFVENMSAFTSHNISVNRNTRIDKVYYGDYTIKTVESKWKEISGEINLKMKEVAQEIPSEILNRIVNGANTNKDVLVDINAEDLEIVFTRVGNLVTEEVKAKIREMLANKDLQKTDAQLFYLLQAVTISYEKQKDIELPLIRLKDVCNKYLIEKEIVYDAHAIKMYVKSTITGKELKLDMLSSGEQHILILFSECYLTSNRDFALFLDEPEISLSILWQRQLLPDIIASKRCKFLFAVTQSPFIYDNELMDYARDFDEFITISSLINA
jgi:predicted ATPase